MAFRREKWPYKPYPLTKTLVLVGMMGCGKTSIAMRLAKIYRKPHVDLDFEVEKAAGCKVSEVFRLYGEAEFRRGEEKIMARLLDGPECILSTGGGSFLSEKTRALAKQKAVTLFLDADVATIVRNTKGRTHRPLLNNAEHPEQLIEKLIAERRPFYEQSDLKLTYQNETFTSLLEKIDALLRDYVRQTEKER